MAGWRSQKMDPSEREAAAYLPPPSGHPRFPMFDPMRAIAATSVLLVHVAILAVGFDAWYSALIGHLEIGVPFFFMLTGFLLYRPMLASRIIHLPAQRLRDYIRNRFFRIFPLYWFILTFTAIVPGMYGAFTGNWWVYYGLLQNLPVYEPEGTCQVDLFRCAIPPAWTLAIEVFFYVLLPFFALAMAWLTRRVGKGGNRFLSRWVVTELGILAALSLLSFWIQGRSLDGDFDKWLFYSPLGRAWWFALGMGMAVISVRVQETGRTPAPVAVIRDHGGWFWAAAGSLYLAGTYLLFSWGPALAAPAGDSGDFVFQNFYFGLVAVLALAPAAFGTTGSESATRILAHPALIRLGLISYGIFLWHYPAMIWLLDIGVLDLPGPDFPLLAISTFALAVMLSAVTYLLLEKPVMRWSRARSARA